MMDLILLPLAGILVILAIHAYLGLHVIVRGVIFVDLAFAQIAALGATAALLLGWEAGTGVSLLFSLGFTLLGALLFSITRMEDSRVPQEAIIGIIFVVASAAVILLAGLLAEGAEHVKETLTGSLIWIDLPTILKMGAVYLVIGLFHWVFRRHIHDVSFDPKGKKDLLVWDFLFYATFGVVITFSVPVAGVLVVFSTLVIPGVIAFLFVESFFPALLLAWASGVVAVGMGLAISFMADLSTGPVLVCSFGATLILAATLRSFIKGGTREDVAPR
ncbi:metal ABC transporter permease [Gemmatimonadota bacterium]